jgi:hypothetical protein
VVVAATQKRVLVVSTVELGAQAVEGLVGDDATTMVVVPAAKQSRLQWLANDEDRARDVAQRASERLANDTPGVTVAAEVGDADPLQAIEDALRRFDADEIVVVTRPEEQATWLEQRVTEHGIAEVNGIPVRRATVDLDGSANIG